jgi:hypothetical protein
MPLLVMLGFEEMNQPIKVYADTDKSVAERDIEIAKAIVSRMWEAWKTHGPAHVIPEDAASHFADLVAHFPVFGRERIINATMHPRSTFGGDWFNWQIVEVDG